MHNLRNIILSATTSIGAIAAASLCTAAQAQTVPSPAVRQPVDQNGVDVSRGNLNVTTADVSIGSGETGMTYVRSHDGSGWRDNLTGSLQFDGAVMTVSLGDGSETFTYSGGVYTSNQGSGSTFVTNGSAEYIYTRSDGTVAVFAASNGVYGRFGNAGYIKSINFKNGLKWTFHVSVGQWCQNEYWNGSSCTVPTTAAARVQSVTNTAGYQIKLNYETDTLTNFTSLASWYRVSKATGVNNAVEYCDPAANSCALTGPWPYMNYALSGQTETATDPTGAQRVITFDTQGRVTSVKRPTASTATKIVSYGTDGRVNQVTNEGVSFNYTWADNTNVRMMVRTAPNASTFRVDTSIATGAVYTVYNETSNYSGTTYDSNWRPYRVYTQEGNYLQYTYDARGNVTETRSVSKTAGSPADIVTTAGYDVNCANIKICNQPLWTRDALGNQTDYTYDPNHGGVLTVTAPAATAGANRPQTRFTYSSLQAFYKNSSGSIVASGQPITLLTSTSACRTGTSCAGTADETKTTVDYGPQTAGVANNLLPISTTSGSGDGLVSATVAQTYDSVGNVTYVDGPNFGTDDTKRILYDSRRMVVGEIEPAPVAGQPNPATRVTYNADRVPTKVEAGTTSGQSDTAWQGFTPAESAETAYDANGRVSTKTLKAGGQSYALIQNSYNVTGQLDCTAVRMNPAVYTSLPASACTLGTQGSDGPDRIVKMGYDLAGRVTSQIRAYGTAEPITETVAYTPNGKTSYVVDGRGNRTTYEYDGHDRLSKTRLPVTTANTSTSSTTDFEQLTYDANSNVLVRRLRDGNTITSTFDNLGRPSSSTPTGEFTVNYSYDLFGNVTQIQRPGDGMTITATYDALGRRLTETQPYGSVSYVYYLDSRLKRLHWSDGNSIKYEYDNIGNVTAIRENGATSGPGVLATYSYDTRGRRTGITRGNGTTTTYTYDAVSRLASLSHDLANTANDLSINSMSYNPAMQLKARTASNNAYAWTGHVNVDRPYTNNGLNQVLTAGATNLGHDARGNLTTSGSSTFGYNKLNQMISAPGVTMTYDPAGRLAQYTAPGTTRFVYAGADMVAELDSVGSILRRYVPGPGVDEKVVWYEGSGLTDRRWYHTDERGSVIAVSDGGGNAIVVNRYDEYGIPQNTNQGRFQYTGQAWLPELGMSYYKARIYSPALGRFMQTDPIGYGDGLNWYSYVGGDPVNYADPSGLDREDNRQNVKPINPWTPPGTGTNIAGRNCSSCTVAASIIDLGGAGPSGTGGRGGGDRSDESGAIVVTGANAGPTVGPNQLLLTSAGFGGFGGGGGFDGGGASGSWPGNSEEILVRARRRAPDGSIIIAPINNAPQVYFGWPSSQNKDYHVDRHLRHLTPRQQQQLLMQIRRNIREMYSLGIFSNGRYTTRFNGALYEFGAYYIPSAGIINVGTVFVSD